MQYDQLGPSKRIGAVVVLNGPSLHPGIVDFVRPPPSHLTPYPIICADGAANLLYDLHIRRCSSLFPTAIVGDLDSVFPHVLDHYKRNGTSVVKKASENSDDFHKALSSVPQFRSSSASELPTIVIGGYGGRFDQTLGNLNALYCEAQCQRIVFWLDVSNVLLVLPKGHHSVSVDASREGPACGLVPIGNQVPNVTTEGLRWNLSGQLLSFGKDGLISTSNEIIDSTVTIQTSHPLLWTTQFRII